MKVMFLLIFIGVAFGGLLVYLGSSSPMAVVEERPYEAAASYDESVKATESLKGVFDNFTVSMEGEKAIFNFKIHPERSSYSDIIVEKAVAAPTMDKSIILTKTQEGFASDKNLKKGWYNLLLYVNADNKTITVKESVYVDK